jgi:hypothetical protein
MFIIRFLFLIFLGLMARRLYLAFKARGAPTAGRPGRGSPGPGKPGTKRPGGGLENLTEQDISDADFEEIP